MQESQARYKERAPALKAVELVSNREWLSGARLQVFFARESDDCTVQLIGLTQTLLQQPGEACDCDYIKAVLLGRAAWHALLRHPCTLALIGKSL